MIKNPLRLIIKSFTILTIFSTLLLMIETPVFAGCFICNNKSVCEGDSKVEVLHICGQPLHISKYEYISKEETWTYVISGCYRYLYFVGNKLVEIIDGSKPK